MQAAIKNLADLNDYIGFVVLCAPNKFPKVGPFSGNPQADVNHAFVQLNEGMRLLEKKLKSDEQMEHLRKILDDSRNAYLEGDGKRGAHLLQDLQDIVFPGRFRDREATST